MAGGLHVTISSSSTPVSTVSMTTNPLINALIYGMKWGGPMGSGVTLTYSFSAPGSTFQSGYGSYNEPSGGFAKFTAAQGAATRAIMTDLSRAVGINFVEVPDDGRQAGELRFGLTSLLASSSAAHAYYPSANAAGGDVWVRNTSTYTANILPGSFNYLVLVHELGHALGLKHSFDGAVRLPANLDHRAFTVMSYNASSVEAVGFLPLDIIALQQVYGVNTRHATGDDRYMVASFGGGIRTIWDAGGTDTFDFTGSAASLSVSLQPGTVRTGSVPYAIAYDTIIEYAVMGAGNDNVNGNEAANWLQGNGGNDVLQGFGGHDLLDGGMGNDWLTGGLGNDTLYGSYGRDISVYALPASAIAWQRNADGSITVGTGGEGVDQLHHIEALQVADRMISLSQPLRRDFNADSREDLITQQAGTGNLIALTWGVTGAAPSTIVRPAAGATLLATGDVNGDGTAELLWRLAGNAGLQFRSLGGAGAPNLSDPGSGWAVRATGDFDGDTKADILWGNAAGQTYIWLMDGAHGASRHGGFASPGAGWAVQGAGDFNGDGKSDILWRHSSGTVWTWLMDGTGISGGGGQSSPGAGWSIKGIGDLDGDAKADIVWRHADGMVWSWMMDGPIAARNGPIGNPGAAWDIVAMGDASGDGLADLIHRNTAGVSWYWVMQGNGIAGAGFVAQQGTDWTFLI